MTTTAELLVDHFGRIDELVHEVVDGASEAALARRPEGAHGPGNPIGWLVWHALRVQDDHLAEAFGAGQAWIEAGWADRFGLDLDPLDTGYKHTSAQVDAVRTTPGLLIGYGEAVHASTVAHLRGIDDGALSVILPPTYGPDISLAQRLVSVIGDDLQHLGQAAYLRGLIGS